MVGRGVVATLSVLCAVAVAAGCAGGGERRDPNTITVWSLESQTDRMQATGRIAGRFTEETGIKVELVAADELQFSQLIISAAAAGQLPDVVAALPLANIWQLQANELLDTASAAAVVDALGPDTFSPQALALTRDGETQLAVPSDAWLMLLIYRRDLFEQAGLEPPTTFERIREAAARLTRGERVGFTAATVADDVFTVQTFEMLALANGCQLVNDAGEITLQSPQCVRAFDLFRELTTEYSVSGTQDVDSTRANYFAGTAAMVTWSSFLLDELGGLRDDALPNCPECRDDPGFLAENSGVVTALEGPDGDGPSHFGEVTSWAITATARKEASRRFVEFMMSDGYLDWLGVAPEGKFPVRNGTAEDSEAYVDGWAQLPAGVDTKRPLGEIYSQETIEALGSGPQTMRRWAFQQRQGSLVGSIFAEMPIQRTLNTLAGGGVSGAEAAELATEDIESIQRSLE